MYFMNDRTTLLPEPSAAVIEEAVLGRIRIRWKATTWDAYVYVPNLDDRPVNISSGQPVTVIGIKGIKLIILL